MTITLYPTTTRLLDGVFTPSELAVATCAIRRHQRRFGTAPPTTADLQRDYCTLPRDLLVDLFLEMADLCSNLGFDPGERLRLRLGQRLERMVIPTLAPCGVELPAWTWTDQTALLPRVRCADLDGRTLRTWGAEQHELVAALDARVEVLVIDQGQWKRRHVAPGQALLVRSGEPALVTGGLRVRFSVVVDDREARARCFA